MNNFSPSVSVLVIAHDARATGGVNNFLRIMRTCIRNRVKIKRMSNGRRTNEKGILKFFARTIFDYLRFIKKISGNVDIVHINPTLDTSSFPREAAFIFLSNLIRPSVKTVTFFRGWNWDAFSRINRNPVYALAFRKIMAWSDAIMVLSPEFKAALENIGVPSSKITVVSTMFEGRVLRRVLDGNVPKVPHQMIFMSRFLAAKGGAEILKAMKKLQTSYPNIRLIMAGDGPERQNWEMLAAELELTNAVSFPGYVSGEAKMRLLAQSTIFLLPTTHPEGMPNALLEAMAAGNVVITTDVGGIKTAVSDGENGTILKRPDVASLVSSIEYYLLNNNICHEMQILNKKKAWSNWESSIVSNKICDIYIEIARRLTN